MTNKEYCNKFNQYYTDIVDKSGTLITTKCFDGKIYSNKFDINNYKKYNNVGYYSWINENFKQFAFPDEDYNSEEYSPELAFAKNCENVVYSLKQQQKFAGRVFNTHVDNRGMLVYHGLGSGKTQTSIVIGEAFKFRKTDKSIIEGRSESRVFIVVPAALQEQYYAEIIGKYESGKIDGTMSSASGEIWISGDRQYYTSKTVRLGIYTRYINIIKLKEEISTETDSGKKIDLQKKLDNLIVEIKLREDKEKVEIRNVYEIISHETFLNRLFKIEDGKYIPQDYLQTTDINGDPTPHGIFKKNSLLIIDEIQNLISATGTNYRRLIYALNYYAHPKFRTVLLTGTPIYDKPYEFGLLMNLLRPRVVFPDGRDAFNAVFLQDNKFTNQESFKRMCSGYISYFKGGNPIAYPYKKTIIMYHSMEEYQYSQYKEALIKEVNKDKQIILKDEEFFINKKEDRVSSGIFNNSNQICNIAFPQVSLTGKSVLQQNIAEFQKILGVAIKENKGGLPDEFVILKKTREFSTKFAKVAEMILKCSGTVFVFSNYVYYGVDAMGIIMNYLGLAPFPNRGPKGSYFIWKGEANKDPRLVQSAKKAFNDPRNIDGGLLKVMFGTQTVMEGVDFKNVNQVHILDPWWNDSRTQQVVARGIRLCSHKDLPIDRRIVDVFIHLSVLGSYEKIYDLEIIDDKGNKRNIKSLMQIENIGETDPQKLIFKQAYYDENKLTIVNSKKTFTGSQIVPVNGILVTKGVDQSLLKSFGGSNWKNLASRSVQEYMYDRSIEKLSINRKFEKVIKEVAIDCSLNKNGNVIRLNEMYTPDPFIDKTWNLIYENYSTGEKFIRLNEKSPNQLPVNLFTLDDILANKKNNLSFLFKNLETNEIVKLNKSLILSENIDCKVVNYSFNFPETIVNLTINKELTKYLFKMKINKIYEFLSKVKNDNQFRKENIQDTTLNVKIKSFMNKKVSLERQRYIDELKEFGWSGDDDLWEQYSLEDLKKEYNLVVKK